jgi:hypothetical protein
MRGNPEIANGSQCRGASTSRVGRSAKANLLLQVLASRRAPEGRLQSLLTARRGCLVVPVAPADGMLIKSRALQRRTHKRVG